MTRWLLRPYSAHPATGLSVATRLRPFGVVLCRSVSPADVAGAPAQEKLIVYLGSHLACTS
jgi:hypothetical protein